MGLGRFRTIRRCGALFALLAAPALAQQPQGGAQGWFERATQTQAEQPAWITPLVTVTPRLEQEYRFDLDAQPGAGGGTAINYGGGKGLEIIPAERLELILGEPGYTAQTGPGGARGFGDMSFLAKYRLAAGNATHGDYIVTLFFGISAPTGARGNSAGVTTFSPTIAAGKGWGRWDVQSTLGLTFPSANGAKIGTAGHWNTALQYRVGRHWWPEIEMNTVQWLNGVNAGRDQVYFTPGLVAGRFPIRKRLGVTAGAGVEIAATRNHAFAHRVIVSLRVPF